MRLPGDPPNEVEAFVGELAGKGFVETGRSISDSFGDVVVEYGRGQLRFAASRDRSIWSIEAATADGHWYDYDIWRACLDGGEAPDPPTSLAEQCRQFIHRLEDINASFDSLVVMRCLHDRGLRRTMQRTGLRLPQ